MSVSTKAQEDLIYLFFQHGSAYNSIWVGDYHGHGDSWEIEHEVPNVEMSIRDSPAVDRYRGRIRIVYQNEQQRGQLWYTILEEVDRRYVWTDPQQVPYSIISLTPNAVVFQGRIHVFYQEAGRNGQLCFVVFNGRSWDYPSKVDLRDAMSMSPSAVVHDNQIYVFYQGPGQNGELRYISLKGSTWHNEAIVPSSVIPKPRSHPLELTPVILA
ncbi:hypothetical protein ASPWEDRAFT_747711 [Aspergillus wentii DTO 134E9]|uniref:Fucose-specific lectin n=1 Tax=Aspergillus wentii DTO 134E9 TaxID=1073089 RepID=A0A1L9R9T4_ASPWE|nr:uncharacterized protein ASPWEDRAFT_747711 [Aspergillus wentii DTO 134E9]KAI9926290.1 hypothetical protein MW887_004054 [Aspergillus wentii]OJJ31680.1 hypothetical protein ASPWEDRAFT_747711 [Aspergillus wentii DTO 134E9]